MIIDTHCHLDKDEYDDINKIISESFCNGVERLIFSGYSPALNLEVIDTINKYANVYGSVGFGPSSVSEIKEEDYIMLEKQLENTKIVSLGEIGLDYHWNDDKEKQKEVFKRQLDIAYKLNKPVVIHNRDANEDIYELLKKYRLKGVIHCFSGDLELANSFIKMGFLIGVGGVITFKNNKLREVIKNISLDNIVLETDAPYLAPEPFRGQKNVPSYIIYVAEEIAKIKGISYEKVCVATTHNALRLFDL